MKKIFLLAILTISLSALAAGKGIDVTINLSPAGSFHVETKKVKGKVVKEGSTYRAKKLYVKIKDLKTGIELRDKHLKKRLLPKKYPKIIVTKLLAKNGSGKATIEIKGIKKRIKFAYKVSKKLFNADFKINLNDFKVKDLKYMGVGAKNMVAIKASIPVK